MASSILRHGAFLISAFSVPAAALLLAKYLYNNPLPAHRARTIITSDTTLSPTTERSAAMKVLNPKDHMAVRDNRSIQLSREDVQGFSDEEILSRFFRGFFGGWIFTPERVFIGTLNSFGVKFVPVQYSGIAPRGKILSSLSDLSSTSLPPRHALLFGGSFMVLNHHISSSESTRPEAADDQSPSFLEIGFGDNSKQFAGMHRFEVSRGEDGVTICYSSVSCNPTVDRPPFSRLLFEFHKFYAQHLFRDGVWEVLRERRVELLAC